MRARRGRLRRGPRDTMTDTMTTKTRIITLTNRPPAEAEHADHDAETSGGKRGSMSIGDQIRRRRRHLDLTQAEVARRATIRQQRLSLYEHGFEVPAAVLRRLARVLGLSPAELTDI